MAAADFSGSAGYPLYPCAGNRQTCRHSADEPSPEPKQNNKGQEGRQFWVRTVCRP